MLKKPENLEAKIKCLEDFARIYVKRFVPIYGGFNSEKARFENYYLCSDGKISAKKSAFDRVRSRISVKKFAEMFGEEGLNYAIKQIKLYKLKMGITENST
jgi:hypothetical protein